MGYKKYSKEQELLIIEEYRKGVPVNDLARKYGYKTKKSITDKIKKYFPEEYSQIIKEAKEKRKGYTYSFEKITSPFDAYLLGLLMTDGYILSDRDGFGLDLTDEDVMLFIAKTIGVNCKKYQKEGYKDKFRILVNNPGITEQLSRFGVVPTKSKIIQPPKLLIEEEQFIPYIIRGIIDGDGGVSKTSYGAPQFYIYTMSESFADWIIDVLTNRFFMSDIHKRQDTQSKIWRIESANQSNILKLIAIVYNMPYGMGRKYKEIRKTFRDYNGESYWD